MKNKWHRIRTGLKVIDANRIDSEGTVVKPGYQSKTVQTFNY